MPELTELKYEQLTDEQKLIADQATILETETNLYLVDDRGRLRGYRAAEMFANGKPVKFSAVLSLENGEPLPPKTKLEAAVEENLALIRTLGSKPESADGLIRWLPLGVIDRCPFQPRIRFDRGRLDELKAGIAEHGFVAEMSHFWVRPHPTQPNRFELIDGGRREMVTTELISEGKYFAVQGGQIVETKGGLVPATVSNLTDAQVLEYALLNALQREELSPIEEAEAVCRLMESPKADGTLPSAAEVAVRLSCSEGHVKRCKLLRRLRDTATGAALEAGRISKAHAEVLARVANEKKRDELLQRVTKPSDGRGLLPVSVLEEWIDREVQISLGAAPFNRSDSSLVPVKTNAAGERQCGGACGEPLNDRGNPTDAATAKIWNWSCPFVEAPRGAPMCLNPECYRLKERAGYDEWRATTATRGAQFVTISAEESDRLWDHTGKRLAPNSGYVELDAKPEEWDLKAGQVNGLTWRKLLRNTACPFLIVKDRQGTEHELAKRDEAKRIAWEIGHGIFRGMAGEPEPAAPAASAAADDGDPRIASAAAGVQRDVEREAAQARREEQARMEKREGLIAARTTLRLKRSVMEGSRGLKRLAPEFWHLILGPMVDAVKEQGGLGDLCEVLGKTENLTNPVDNEDFLDRIVRGTPAEQMPSLAIVVAREMLYAGETEDWMKLACKTFGVDVKAARKCSVAEVEAEEAAEAERAEIEAGVVWLPPLRSESHEFEWLADGDCANPAIAELKLPKGVKHSALIGIARTLKGWVAGYAVKIGKKQLGQEMPSRNGVTYANPALATATALRAVLALLDGGQAPEPAAARVRAYIANVKLPAEKPRAKAAKPAKKKAGKKGK